MSESTEKNIKHLEFIQNVITRMNQNSFQIKGLTITIISALLALYANNKSIAFLFITLLPIAVFWALDAYYLQQERKYRGLYNDVAGLRENFNITNDWDMNASVYKKNSFGYWSSFFSVTLVFFYFGTATVVGLICLLMSTQ